MRTAADFNRFYAIADPWKVDRAAFRDRVFRRFVPEVIRGKTVLELGCGEGHLTDVIFSCAKSVTGIDISDVAIARAKARNLPNARFENLDLLRTSFEDYEVIAALECLYYLSSNEQEAFFAKVAREHAGKILIMSAPIIGENQFRRYFTHGELMATFARHRMRVTAFHNLNVNRNDALTTAAAVAARIAPAVLDFLPARIVYQRLYIIRMM